MVVLIALVIWRLHWLIVLAVWLPIVTFDGLFLSAALIKVPDGAWFTILLAILLSSIFVLWRYGKENQWAAEGTGRSDLMQLVIKGEDGHYKLPASFGGRQLTHIRGRHGLKIEESKAHSMQVSPSSLTKLVTWYLPSMRNF